MPWKTSPPTPPLRPLSVVIADDVPEIRELVTAWLAGGGHTVIETATGRELLEILRQRPVDLVITDIVMPDGDGHDVIATVSRIWPDVRILAISGGGKTMPKEPGLRIAKGLGADALLPKPFTKEQLLAAIQKVMPA
jgi:CheY-like chemotaxis protein